MVEYQNHVVVSHKFNILYTYYLVKEKKMKVEEAEKLDSTKIREVIGKCDKLFVYEKNLYGIIYHKDKRLCDLLTVTFHGYNMFNATYLKDVNVTGLERTFELNGV